MIAKEWQLTINPNRWLKLPRSKALLKTITIKWNKNSNVNSVIDDSCAYVNDFKLAVATIPFKVLPYQSSNNSLDLSRIKQQNILIDGKLNFAHVFGAWIVFNHDVDWSILTPTVIYTIEEN